MIYTLFKQNEFHKKKDIINVEKVEIMRGKSSAFLSIDIAFAIVLMSFALMSFLYIQKSISNGLSNSDIQHFNDANASLLNHIKQNNATTKIITTQNNKSYNLKLISSVNQPLVKLDFYKK